MNREAFLTNDKTVFRTMAGNPQYEGLTLTNQFLLPYAGQPCQIRAALQRTFCHAVCSEVGWDAVLALAGAAVPEAPMARWTVEHPTTPILRFLRIHRPFPVVRSQLPYVSFILHLTTTDEHH